MKRRDREKGRQRGGGEMGGSKKEQNDSNASLEPSPSTFEGLTKRLEWERIMRQV